MTVCHDLFSMSEDRPPEDDDSDEEYDTDKMHEMFEASALIEKAKKEKFDESMMAGSDKCLNELGAEFVGHVEKMIELDSHITDLKR